MESNLTSSSGQDSITNSQSTRSKTNPAWEHVSEERYANGRKALICLYCKKITKCEDIHRMKQHLARVKEDIGPCKSVPPDWIASRNTQGAQPSMMSVLAGKDAIWRADMAVGRFFYYDAKKEVQLLVDSYRAIWAKVGCTIMSDGWTDNRERTLINFLVYCPEGISFVKSVDASDIVKDATNLFQLFDEENFCNKPNVIGGVMDVIDQKVLKGKLETMNEMKLFRNRLRSFGRDLAYSSREVLQPVDDDQPVELDVEELENLLYEEWSIPINEVKGSSFHIDDEDGGNVAIEGLDVENFGFPNAHVQSPYSNFQNE
ncbi:hypothetical protein CK203_068587 [Vitis vinifera]|uniref:DUF659 domain-containing protein n=1 Tax=Vitis vinifera TaxID=29760 RepID=A0A438EEA7_VITVI|nr:hypothetical protein CK203_068587 [Vitis vinifera]